VVGGLPAKFKLFSMIWEPTIGLPDRMNVVLQIPNDFILNWNCCQLILIIIIELIFEPLTWVNFTMYEIVQLKGWVQKKSDSSQSLNHMNNACPDLS